VNLNVDIKKGIFDRFRSLPIARGAPLIGSMPGDMICYVLALVTLLAVGYLLGFRVQIGLLSGLGVAALAIWFGSASVGPSFWSAWSSRTLPRSRA
jgi:oleandomycin transport system permease protein